VPLCPYTDTQVSALVGVALKAQALPPGACGFTADDKDPAATQVFVSLSTKAEGTTGQPQICADIKSRFGTSATAGKGNPSCQGANTTGGKALIVTDKGTYAVAYQSKPAQSTVAATQAIMKKLIDALPS
jgi:hypothetical protein